MLSSCFQQRATGINSQFPLPSVYQAECNSTQSQKQHIVLIARVYGQFYVKTDLGDKKNANFGVQILTKLSSNILVRSINDFVYDSPIDFMTC